MDSFIKFVMDFSGIFLYHMRIFFTIRYQNLSISSTKYLSIRIRSTPLFWVTLYKSLFCSKLSNYNKLSKIESEFGINLLLLLYARLNRSIKHQFYVILIFEKSFTFLVLLRLPILFH